MDGGKIVLLLDETGQYVHIILKSRDMPVHVIFCVLSFLSQNMKTKIHRIGSEKPRYNKKTNGEKKDKTYCRKYIFQSLPGYFF